MDPAPRILVVEDEADIRECVAEALRIEGFEVETARDGLDALAVLRAGRSPPVAALVVDVMMPRLTGPEFVERARRERLAEEIPVITITASDGAIDGEVARLRKPFELADLIRAIRECSRAHP